MATFDQGGTWTGPGGSVAWRLTGPGILANVEYFDGRLQGALRRQVITLAKTLKAGAQAAYANTTIAPLFGYRTEAGVKRVQLTLFNTSPIFPFVEYDTKPHRIEARRAPYLLFKIGDRWVRAKAVNHPGTKGRYAVAALFAQHESQFRAAVLAAAQEALTHGVE